MKTSETVGTTSKKIQIGIVDDDDKFRAVITRMINTQPDFLLALEARSGIELFFHPELPTLDIILMDIELPLMSGIETSEKVTALYPGIKIIALTNHFNDRNIREMYSRGAKSFIHKVDTHELFKAIRTVNKGGTYLTNPSLVALQQLLRSNGFRGVLPGVLYNLNENEIRLLRCICKGLSSADIAKVINKSQATVEKQRADLYRKFNVTNKKELIEIAQPLLFGDN